MKFLFRVLSIILLYFSILGWFWQEDFLAAKNREASKLYKEHKTDEALSKWRDAQIENPDRKELYYNIGNALHEQKKYEDAFREYEKSLDSKNTELKARAYYNIGNTYYRMDKLPEAIESYEKCLDIKPDDADAKYNIEFIKKKMKEKQESQPQEQKESAGQSGGQKESAGQPQASEEKKESESKGVEAEKKEQAKETGKEEASNQEVKEGQMTKEDAVRLLDALKNDEKPMQEELLKHRPIEGGYRVDKDW